LSRVGRKPIPIPAGVQVTINGNLVEVTGPKGELKREFLPQIEIVREGEEILVKRQNDAPKNRAAHGLTRALLNNMVDGVTRGFEKSLVLSGVGYRASKQGNKLVLNVGYSHPVEIIPEEGLEIEVPSPTKVTVKGIDKEQVGALAARIRAVREPEPYKGKGIKYENETIRRKEGKTGSKK